MLVTIGDLVEELLVQLPRQPAHGSVTHVRSARIRGGSAANVAAMTAERGHPSRFVGRVGADTLGRALAEDLADRGVDTRIQLQGGTGVAVTLVDGRRRTTLIDRGASARVESVERDVLADATQLYVCASTLVSDPAAATVLSVLRDAAEARISIVLRMLGVTDVSHYGADAFLSFVGLLRPAAVIGNRSEHRELGLEPAAALDGASVTVVTDGPRPTRVLNDRGLDREISVRPVESLRDITGAGDGFVTGFLESHREGADPIAATESGHRIAALVLKALGPTTRS